LILSPVGRGKQEESLSLEGEGRVRGRPPAMASVVEEVVANVQ